MVVLKYNLKAIHNNVLDREDLSQSCAKVQFESDSQQNPLQAPKYESCAKVQFESDSQPPLRT